MKWTMTMLMAAAALSISLTTARAEDCESCKIATRVQSQAKSEAMNRFGGPIIRSAPALEATASLVEAGGGPESFSIAKALTAMVGEELVKAEVEKLIRQYGEEKVKSWLMVFDYAVKEALQMAKEAGVQLPKGSLSGKRLASTLVKAGLDKSDTFFTCTMLDRTVSHPIHVAAMKKIDEKFGMETNLNYHAITNQAMYDLAQALGMKKVKLSPLH
jgi:3-hydroxyisobutyrate dehydrogenase-like beta-hydroxyacid dehydrogenase